MLRLVASFFSTAQPLTTNRPVGRERKSPGRSDLVLHSRAAGVGRGGASYCVELRTTPSTSCCVLPLPHPTCPRSARHGIARMKDAQRRGGGRGTAEPRPRRAVVAMSRPGRSRGHGRHRRASSRHSCPWCRRLRPQRALCFAAALALAAAAGGLPIVLCRRFLQLSAHHCHYNEAIRCHSSCTIIICYCHDCRYCCCCCC